ncbi:F-box domain protein [Cordyceps fumosorosea ARSEF 2679]|uniref:F-box domain protein n=1 Tax=Cordyceps fumosorosea (strain ARSEF 2679) TaxID=1081104 RepID=A0A168E571_CORFA|nr:F-box domain protein [Cordyceps fumosorosea ARSEF 2679]OAA73390.1 F-box domain protein [Cordyceps fumosorosea ARSEF 2679]
MPMTLDDRLAGMYSNFMLTKPLDPDEADKSLSADYPYHHIWPPPAIPARHHVAGIESGQAVAQTSTHDRPRRRSQVSDQTFRIRQWMELTGTPPPPLPWAGAPLHNGNAGAAPMGVHIGEEIVTYSTLDPTLYTPTATKPWRGIWVGDYSGHGCEFLLVNQPDDLPATDLELGLERGDTETEDEWQRRRLDARIYRGRLEAIKLTGDPNIPRGEYTFVADDLGPAGYVGDAQDEMFAGARMVRSKGHVAAAGFHRGTYCRPQ